MNDEKKKAVIINAFRAFVTKNLKCSEGPGQTIICKAADAYKGCTKVMGARGRADLCGIPDIPPDLKVSQLGTFAGLNWKIPPGAYFSDVEIQRLGPGDSDFKTITTTVGTSNGINDNKVKMGQTLSYRIRGTVDSGATTSWSQVKAITLAKVSYLPEAPLNLKAAQVSGQLKVKLTWDLNKNSTSPDSPYQIKGYRIYRYALMLAGGSEPKMKVAEKQGTPTAASLEYMDAVPMGGKKYQYEVVPYNDSGEAQAPPNVVVEVKDTGVQATGKPDITAAPQVKVAAVSANWGGTITVDSGLAAYKDRNHSGMCEFNIAYTVKNIGAAVADRFRGTWRNSANGNGWSQDVEFASGLAAKGGAVAQQNLVPLKPGMNQLKLLLNSWNSIQEADLNNNSFTINVNVTGNCTNIAQYGPGTPKLQTTPFKK